MDSHEVSAATAKGSLSPRRYRAYQQKMERVLQSAAELFFTKGYHETALVDIARAAGMGKASLYHYIDSKDRLLYEILKQGTEEIVQTYTAIRNDTIPTREKLRQLLVQMSLSKENVLQRCLMRPGREALSEPLRTKIAARANVTDLLVREILQEGVDRGEIKPLNVIVMTDMLIGASFWAGKHHQPGASVWTDNHQPGKFAAADLLETWYTVFSQGLFTDGETRKPSGKSRRK